MWFKGWEGSSFRCPELKAGLEKRGRAAIGSLLPAPEGPGFDAEQEGAREMGLQDFSQWKGAKKGGLI